MAVTSPIVPATSQTTIATPIVRLSPSRFESVSIIITIRRALVIRKFLIVHQTQILADRLGQYCQVYTLYSSVRPFGLSALLGGVDPETGKAGLYCIEPSGVYWVRFFSFPRGIHRICCAE
jgi:hypothetical protein